MKQEKDYTDFEELEGKVNKLSDVELKELQDAVNAVNGAQMQIGGIESYKADLIAKLSILVKELETNRGLLSEKYGSVDIDLITGVVKEIRKDEVDTKN